MKQIQRSSAIAALAGASATLLLGCHVGPNYRSPAPLAGAEAPLVSLEPSLETAISPPDAWWRLYDDPRLESLVQEALSANRDLAAADANLAAARAVIAAVHANRYPATEAVSAAVRGRDPVTEEILEIGGHAPQTIWLFEDVFQAAYEVDLFGRVHRSIEAANADAQVAEATRDGVRVVVAAEAAREYAAVCALGDELAVAHHSLDVVGREAQITAERYAAGGGSRYDVERTRAVVEQVRAGIPQLEGQRRTALFGLAALLGRAPTEAPRELESCTTPPHLSALIPVGDGRTLIRRRPDVRRAERRLASATARIGVATADLYPSIRLSAFFGGATTEFSQLGSNAARIWGVGPTISWTFPNAAGPRARVLEAKAGQRAALAEFDSAVLTALKEAEQTLTAYRADLAYRAALAAAQEHLRAAFEAARNSYQAGSLSALELLTTEQSLVAVDASVASSDTRLVQDQIAIFKALGGGWSSAPAS